MLRKLLFISLLGLLFLSSGFFMVDQREVVFLRQGNDYQQISAGLHWRVPFSSHITYVYTNLQHSSVAMASGLQTKDGKHYNGSLSVEWQIINPQQFIKFLHENDAKQFKLNFATTAWQQVQQLSINATDIVHLSSLIDQKLSGVVLKHLGIKINHLGLFRLQLIAAQESSIMELRAESAYITARKIKQQADLLQESQMAQLAKQDTKFFRYWRKIHYYQENASNKAQVPPLNQLYSD
jgi:hypothetical protein